MAVEAASELAPPLCVDLDFTLIRGDLLLESLVQLVKRNPLGLLLIPLWLLRGTPRCKHELAQRVQLNPAALPYNKELLEWLKVQRAIGRRMCLCTASHERPAQRVAHHLGLFDGVVASTKRTNLAGRCKAAQLVNRFGERGFDYCGNEHNAAVWERARGAIVVEAGSRRQAATGATEFAALNPGPHHECRVPCPALSRCCQPSLAHPHAGGARSLCAAGAAVPARAAGLLPDRG